MSGLKYHIIILFVLICGLVPGYSQDPENLKEYTFVLLTAGEVRDQGPDELKFIQSGHLDHIADMAESGLLSIAGPFSESGEWRGLLIFNTSDTLIVKNKLHNDPAVKAGRLNFKIHQFYSTPGRCLE